MNAVPVGTRRHGIPSPGAGVICGHEPPDTWVLRIKLRSSQVLLTTEPAPRSWDGLSLREFRKRFCKAVCWNRAVEELRGWPNADPPSGMRRLSSSGLTAMEQGPLSSKHGRRKPY